MKYLILPLTKGPHPTGRIGPRRLQDWRRALKEAVAVAYQAYFATSSQSFTEAGFPATMLILSDVQIAGEEHEVELYSGFLDELGFTGPRIVLRETYETIGQLDRAFEIAQEEDFQLVVVSTFLHYPRVRWLCRGRGAIHKCVWGIPRPREAITDIILAVVFPFIDMFGWRKGFLQKVNKRRQAGVH